MRIEVYLPKKLTATPRRSVQALIAGVGLVSLDPKL